MNSYTAVLNGGELNKVLQLPKEYLNAQVEVKVKVLKRLSIKKPSKFEAFFGVTQVDNIEEEIKAMRNEDWK